MFTAIRYCGALLILAGAANLAPLAAKIVSKEEGISQLLVGSVFFLFMTFLCLVAAYIAFEDLESV